MAQQETSSNETKAIAYGPGWTQEGISILERGCEHYGGLEAWQRIRKVRLYPERLTGLVPHLKGVEKTFSLPSAIDVYPHQVRTVFLDYPGEGLKGRSSADAAAAFAARGDGRFRGVFECGAVRIEGLFGSHPSEDANRKANEGGFGRKLGNEERRPPTLPKTRDEEASFRRALAGYEVLEESPQHRDSFKGLAKSRRWAPLDALYFFGYALWHYHAVPFGLAGARLLRVRKRASLSVLELQFPTELPTHSQRQAFYFDEAGRIVRHDYVADILGTWARGAHFWRRQSVVNGFPIALERHVTARCGAMALPFVTALHATFRGAEVDAVAAGGSEHG